MTLSQAAFYLAVGFVAGLVSWWWASRMEDLADGCSCSKGRVCDACLAASEAIRPGGGS